ncbi:OPT oligopeptide transporter protein-domain-containing protein [Aspergillus pseudotamarii]|uniref:OPT oligopeptide transporter protein-domain-containing protein n=1 Tax=Aspergillus pseudotamarii TaxID=132259 RepID=A0A5N6SG00_ASPPS|nr:OPT oligopeptide transporter protein-domain-containing protein [Aspergillus pseudotamarii]KAE8132024.1 OPT oligopeptide transporter protein-domain-containing protein [Aspergillus pseudotamarii]
MKEKETGPTVAVTTGAAIDEAAPDAAISHLKQLKKEQQWDPNLPEDVTDEIDDKAGAEAAEDLIDNSPYPEVRAAVPNYDEGGHTNTIRAWVIGLVLATVASGMNMLFSLRQPYIVIPSYVVQVVAYPIGVGWAMLLPNKTFSLFGLKFNLNPGPFSKKEHAIAVLMANASFGGGTAYATDIIVAQRAFYKQRFGWGYELLLCICTQMLGFGFAGFFHRFLVAPAAMIWPSTLINTSIFSALHDRTLPDPRKVAGWTIGRYRMFLYCLIGSFVWYWFPGYIAPFLSVFAWVTWIKPQSPVINQLFGGWTGLSLLPITFDWTQISGFNFSPLISPWHAHANTLIGMVVFYWICTIGLHYSNAYWFKHLPISDSSSYDNLGKEYDVSRILTPEFTFDAAKYKEYSPLFLSTTFALCYGLSFAGVIAVLLHAILFHGKEVLARLKTFRKTEDDIHARLMARFKPVPLWWYGALFLTMMGIGLGVSLGYPTHLSWWAFFIALIMAIVWTLPVGIVQAATNIQLGLNVLTEFVIGYMQPGKPMAMMLFKTFGYISMSQGLYFCQDMKLGHYMKIPPRVTFAAQMVATLWTSIVQIAVMNWALGSIDGVCELNQPNHYTCPNGRVFFNASVIWGVIGPARMFSPGQLYSGLMWFWLAGAALPVLIYLGARIWPRSKIRYLSAPLIFTGAGLIPPATPLNYLSWGIVGFIFNKWIRTRWRGWWMQYNYVLSAGLDVGLTLSTIVIFLCLQLTGTKFPSWWGTRIAANTMDAAGEAVEITGEKFGPATW